MTGRVGARLASHLSEGSSDEERVSHLARCGAVLVNIGDYPDPEWLLLYQTRSGEGRCVPLEAQAWEEAVSQACEFV